MGLRKGNAVVEEKMEEETSQETATNDTANTETGKRGRRPGQVVVMWDEKKYNSIIALAVAIAGEFLPGSLTGDAILSALNKITSGKLDADTTSRLNDNGILVDDIKDAFSETEIGLLNPKQIQDRYRQIAKTVKEQTADQEGGPVELPELIHTRTPRVDMGQVLAGIQRLPIPPKAQSVS